MDMYRSAEQRATARTNARRASATLVLIFTVLACAEAHAQDGAVQQQAQRDDGPPPLRYMPPDVRQRLEGAKDVNARARLSMEIAEERLVRAAQFADQDKFEAATGEIGVYEAVIEDTVRTLHASGGTGRASNKLRDIFKRIEITLRSHVTRLESIRRLLPERHAVYLKDAIDFVRDRRDLALSAFYSDSVLREPRHPELTTPDGERATTNTAAQPEAEKKPN
ncbi:MAG: hypothetical protein QOH49_4427 [Acidobacteriota bacterium]|jgi:hypothetical protein|nr:hypothetical protein [Acidobacteriota bacterium]